MIAKWYPQTWHYVIYLPMWVQKVIRDICYKTVGHEWSKTESGYCGGEMLDVWCRWCNQKSNVPISEMPSKEYLRDLFEDEQN